MADRLAERLSARAEAEVRDIARAYARVHGTKLGLHRFGVVAGIGERRARGIYYGEAASITAGEYLAAREADLALRQHERAALRARLDQIEAELRGTHVETDGVGTRSPLAMAGAAG